MKEEYHIHHHIYHNSMFPYYSEKKMMTPEEVDAYVKEERASHHRVEKKGTYIKVQGTFKSDLTPKEYRELLAKRKRLAVA